MEDDAVGLDRTGGVHGGAHGLDALGVHRLVRRREIAEVERMHEHVPDPRLDSPLPEAGEILLGVDGKCHVRGLWANSCTASAPISAARSIAPLIPPLQWAPNSTPIT